MAGVSGYNFHHAEILIWSYYYLQIVRPRVSVFVAFLPGGFIQNVLQVN